MIIKHYDLNIPDDNPFENCKLDRKKYAEILTQIVDKCNDGFVLVINNEWGTGKTTFIKMWRQLLTKEGFRTLYFNAWENDFELNPLTAILAELKKLLPKSDSKSFNSLLSKGAVIAQNVLPAIAKVFAKRFMDAEVITEGIEKVTKAATEILKDEIKSYTARQKGLNDFRKELENYVKQEEDYKPLIFFIDELDRCKPTYAVEVLEQMKHFFVVPGIIFVLAIDKTQLGNAVKGVYGSEQLDSDEYLRRFIDIEYAIPAPPLKAICNYFFDYDGFGDFFHNEERIKYRELQKDKELFLNFALMLFESKKLTLRQQEKMFGHARLALISFAPNSYVFPSVFLLLIYLHFFHKEVYFRIKNLLYKPQEFLDEIEKIFSEGVTENNARTFVFTEALLLFIYHNNYRELNRFSKLINEDRQNNISTLLVKSRFEPNEESFWLLKFIESFERGDTYSFKLENLINRIDLLESIK